MGDRYSKLTQNFTETNNFGELFVGPLDYIIQPTVLDELNINAVMCCTGKDNSLEFLKKKKWDLEKNFKHVGLEDCFERFISLMDVELDKCIDWIYEHLVNGRNVLVHCDHGITRSPSMCIAYLMKYGKSINTIVPMTLHKACDYLYNTRKNIDITLFIYDLKKWEKQLNLE
jgi:protein-tyrosine phosphatase